MIGMRRTAWMAITAERPTWITDHAVDRYIERHQRGVGRDTARAVLTRLVRESTLHEVEDGARTIWRTACGILLGVEGKTVRTVLPAGSRRPSRRPRKRRS